MVQFVLVHGSAHGAWCWDAVLPRLAAAGHRARAIDLPAHGPDPARRAPAGGRVTLEDYADAILDALDGPTVLVGHSAGGFAITLAAARAPERVSRLIYLCAYVPAEGQSIAALRRAHPEQPLAGAIRVAPDRLSYAFDPAEAATLFYHDCPPEIAAAAAARLVPEPVAPQETPLPAGLAVPAVPRDYILCTRDRAIPPALQARMSAGFAPECRHRLAASHSPFLSMPDRLARMLVEIAETS